MKDTRDLVVTILNVIAPTEYMYPSKIVNPPDNYFPRISYWDSNHNADGYEDNKSTLDDLEYTIDCWERQDSSGDLNEIHFAVDSVMRNAGYRRTMYVPQYESDTKIYHYSMKFKKIEEDD